MREPDLQFRDVRAAEDLARLEAALRALSAEIEEGYATDPTILAQALLSNPPAAYGLLVLSGGQTSGAALYSPVFSTVRGAAGVYVSDLWVGAEMRGQGLGAQLLGKVARAAAARWQANWLKLAVYDHSHAAQQFYQRLGFAPAHGMQELRLGPQAVADLIKRTA